MPSALVTTWWRSPPTATTPLWSATK
jgi:hypothetical protein